MKRIKRFESIDVISLLCIRLKDFWVMKCSLPKLGCNQGIIGKGTIITDRSNPLLGRVQEMGRRMYVSTEKGLELSKLLTCVTSSFHNGLLQLHINRQGSETKLGEKKS